MRTWLVLGAVLAGVVTVGVARAETKLSGTFVADATCPATQTIKSGKNPGNVNTETGQNYDLLAGNRDEPTHYMIRVPGADPERRWVKVSCGHVAGAAAAPAAPAAPVEPDAPQKKAAGGKPEYVFALSWQPAFCETKSRKTECRAMTGASFAATNFTLHGLWPQPNGNFYCAVSAADRANDKGNWQKLPPVNLDGATRSELDEVMPGTASQLERHEWIKHGTCYGKDQQAYFADALALMRQVNSSPVRELFESNIGKELTSQQIREAFDSAFGKGTGDRVRVSCFNDRGRRMIGEVTLGLAGPIGSGSSLKDLMLASAPTDNAGCPGGEVDRVGLQ
ncbi:ribonuclease [Mesorhizobium sp. 1M-11]|uniref:ribonuclease T2 family protein n=1 Tax=Mesorhizobium sp. 1M-11 TaxID=1529006 RepID=UPI0006C73820|nr:ribonuclease [Mesorhizobium sp. 1M-11]